MASDAFSHFQGTAVEDRQKSLELLQLVQPGGSIKIKLSIDLRDANDLAIGITGTRHFLKHYTFLINRMGIFDFFNARNAIDLGTAKKHIDIHNDKVVVDGTIK